MNDNKCMYSNFPVDLRLLVEEHMKRSRAMVTKGGQCVLLQNSLRMKMYFLFFLKYPRLPYESHLSRHTSDPLKKL